jgi:parvulin-like peptidyl-prolyl isomerase
MLLLRRWTVVSLLMSLTACHGATRREPRQEVARVNNEVIFADELKRETKLGQIEDIPKDVIDTPEQRRRYLETLIDRKLLLSEAARLHVLVPSDQAERLFARMKDDYPSEDFANLLQEKRLTAPELKQAIREQLLISKLLRDEVEARIALTDQEVMNYLAQHPELSKRDERVRCSQIVQKTLPEINKVRGEIQKGMPFEEAAARYSIAPEAKQGGDLGYFGRGVMPEVVDKACFTLPVSSVSDVVSSDYGFHLFKVADRKPAETLPLDKAHELAEGRLRTERLQQAEIDFLAKLRAAAQIKVDEAILAGVK